MTYSTSLGVTYRASEKWSVSASNRLYYNDDSVENLGHNTSLTGNYDINENWEVHGGYRYLGYDLDGSSLDDYDASIITLGVTGRF
jgi:long-subunit fatty acid transport protein